MAESKKMTGRRPDPIHKALLLVLLIVASTDAGRPLKILGIFPHPGVSHFYFFHPIMRGLAEAGHDVTVISHFPDKSPPVRYRDLPLPSSESEEMNGLVNFVDLEVFAKHNFWTHIKEFFFLTDLGLKACNTTLRSEALSQVLREKKRFDIVIVEVFNTDCALGIAHVLKAPVVGLSSCSFLPWHFERFGIPIEPSYMPVLFLGYSHEMSFMERVSNWINFHLLIFLYNQFAVKSADSMLRHKFGHDMPSVGELAKDISCALVNTHYSLSGVKPYPPSVIEVGGVHIQKAKPIPVELQRWLDNAENGAIIFSWGSMIRANSLAPEKRDALLKAFQRLRMRVIWKWENDTVPNKPDNVLISKWLPQRDILCHPNVKVFMGHGGLMGTSEAVHCGVPMVLTPIYGDQHLNSAAIQSRGMGIILKYHHISENTVMKAVKKVLEKSFADNAKAVAHSYNHRPMTAIQSSIWWVEHVARTEGAPLTKSSAVHMSRFTYYSLDVYLILGTVTSILLSFWVWIVCKLHAKRLRKQKEKSN